MFNNNLLMGAASAGGDSLVSVGNSALYTTTSQELERTPGSAGNVDKFTFSAWVYMCNPTSGNTPIFGAINTSANQHRLFTTSGGTLQFDLYLSNSFVGRVISSQVLRDIGWYHIVAVYDSGNAIAGDRMKIYLNGERITDLTSVVNPSQNLDGLICGAHLHQIGMHDGFSTTLDGYMAEAVLLDGTVAEPSSFGQYDSTGTFWTPLSSATIKALTFGTTGFYLDNTTNAQTDASGEGNNFTNTGSVALSTHTPTNLNALFNPLNFLDITTRFPVMTVGNTTTGLSTSGSSATGGLTFPVTYNTHIEFIFSVAAASGFDHQYPTFKVFPFNGPYTALVQQPSGNFNNDAGLAAGATKPNFANGDRITMEIDASNGRIYLWQNGSALNSANPGANSGFTFDYTPPASGAVILAFTNGNSTSKTLVNSNPADFEDTVSAGYFPLTSTAITAQTTRTKSNLEEYFDSTLYEGNGAGQRVGKFLPFTNAFTVGNSALFDDGDTELTRTPSSDGNLDAWTFSTWVKFCNNDNYHSLFGAGDSSSNQMVIYRLSDGALRFQLYAGASFVGRLITTRKFLDTSKWYNVVAVWNSGSSTSSERMRIFVDGVRITSFSTEVYPSQNLDGFVNDASYKHFIGNDTPALADASDVYLSQTVLLDGTTVANADNFGQVDTSTGRWIPKQITGLTMGTNGFFMDYAASGANLGDDAAGSIDYANDGGIQVADTPTVNFSILDGAYMYSGYTNGNLTMSGFASVSSNSSTIGVSSGKWYCELTCGSTVGSPMLGVVPFDQRNKSQYPGQSTNGIGWDGGTVYRNNGTLISSYASSFSNNEVNAIMLDLDNNQVTFRQANTAKATIDLNTPQGTTYYFYFRNGGTSSANNATVNFGASDFTYTIPTDYLALSQDNMPEGESYLTAFSWIKNRDAADNHMLFDRVRGIYNDMHSNTTAQQVTNVNTLQRFLNGGVQVGNDVEVNTANESYVAWNWYMETTGSGTSNTDGTINTTATLVDTNIGLSISQFTGTGANATIGHGLGVVPQMFWVKGIDAGNHWYVYHADNTSAPETDALLLGGTNGGYDDATLWNDTAPTSSVISIGTNTDVNQSSKKFLAMAFAPSQFTSIGGYIGNGNANGTFVPTVNSLGIPIQPAWVMFKSIGTSNGWGMYDNQRDPFNTMSKDLRADLSNAENIDSSDKVDIVTGGLKNESKSWWN